ncbi:DUF2135 domain-containing protein, partial [Shigella boydii]
CCSEVSISPLFRWPNSVCHFNINYYGGRSETELTTAQLTLITDEGSVNEKQETFIVPMRNAGELTLVKSFDW